ncbi:type VI secretion system tip protein VgrG [Bradyrhizobium prioriisuperbiae]|uniref:type VI secretion system tip protein VgrG n=1 Tax=Bradyrhizobium prioriisuperbiae TaxID=2854389 RepID=UPI0028F04952|nr:type VI secretion system tip protein VgrG [Bradyrhizobium prioritasuperba]
MTAPSPVLAAGSLSSFSIKSEGKPIDSSFQVVSIEIWNAVNKVPKARVVLSDGDPAEQDFEISNLPTFIPGKKIEIAAGYDGTNRTIFRGVVVKQGIEISDNGSSQLIVDITDEAIKMALERKNALFDKITDSDLIGKLITGNGLSKDVAATNTVHEEIVQYYASDWDLMLTRAQMNGFVVVVENGKVVVNTPDNGQSPVLTVEYGDSILDLRAEINAATQYASTAINSYTWDPDSQKLAEAGPGPVKVTEQGNLSSADLAKVFGVKKFAQQTGAPIEKTALKDWSSAELLKSKLSKIRGQVSFQGSALAQTGKTIALAGLGNRFNGNAYVSGVHHCITDGEWLTTTYFGLSERWFAAEAPEIAAPEASGQLPPIKGLQTGVVKKVAGDPNGEFRVFVALPLLQDDAKGVWARLGTFYASNKVGAVFYPEIGDEVVVGFMNEDPRYAVILASVYSKKLAPPIQPDQKNNKKSLVTRSKLEISFDEESKIIEIKTPGSHSIKLDDKGKAITIKDSNGNTVSLSKSGISLDSASNVNITAKGNITIAAKGNLKLSAKANATMEGLQVAHKAQTKFSAQGTAQAEVTASGMLTLQGGLVKIN